MNRSTTIFLFLILNVLAPFFGYSQSTTTTNQKPALHFNQLLEGLNNERVTSVGQDQFGFIWIGTYNGLHRYDGMKFRIYSNTSDSSSIPNSRIEKIFTDSNGNLWVGTANGLCRYNWEKDNFTRYPLSSGLVDPSDPSPNKITAIVQDKEGTLWVGSAKEGLLSFNQESDSFSPFFRSKKEYSFSSMFVTEVSAGKNNDLWVGLNNGLNVLNTKTGEVHSISDKALKGKNIRGLAMEENGDMWVGTWEDGLFLIKENGNIINYKHDPDNANSLGNNSIYSIFIDNQKRLWVGNENGGLHLYDRGDNVFYRYAPDESVPNSITSNSIWALFQDQQDRLWIGTANSGVNIVDKYFLKFTHHYSSPLNPDGLNNNIISGFWEEKNGNV